MRAIPVAIKWHPALSIYAAESFLRAVGDEYGWLGGIDDSGQLRCVLPYTVIRKATLRMVRFRVETIPLGGERLGVDEERSFLNDVVHYFRSSGADMIIPATTNTIFRTHPDGALVAPYGSYIIDLTESENTLWKNLQSKHRNVIRNAMKKGVEVRTGPQYLETAYDLVTQTLKRSRLGFMAPGEFNRLITGLDAHVKIFVADYQGVVQGCAIVPFSDHSAYYLYGGSIPEPVTGAMNLLHWRAMLEFRELGVKRYDFVGTRINPPKGSKQDGLMTFKQRFGGQLVQGYIWKYHLRSIKSVVYSVGVRLLRGGDIVDQERHKLAEL